MSRRTEVGRRASHCGIRLRPLAPHADPHEDVEDPGDPHDCVFSLWLKELSSANSVSEDTQL